MLYITEISTGLIECQHALIVIYNFGLERQAIMNEMANKQDNLLLIKSKGYVLIL